MCDCIIFVFNSSGSCCVLLILRFSSLSLLHWMCCWCRFSLAIESNRVHNSRCETICKRFVCLSRLEHERSFKYRCLEKNSESQRDRRAEYYVIFPSLHSFMHREYAITMHVISRFTRFTASVYFTPWCHEFFSLSSFWLCSSRSSHMISCLNFVFPSVYLKFLYIYFGRFMMIVGGLRRNARESIGAVRSVDRIDLNIRNALITHTTHTHRIPNLMII